MRQFLAFFMANFPKKLDEGSSGTADGKPHSSSPNANSPNNNSSPLTSQQYKAMNEFISTFEGYMSWQGSEVRRQVNPLSKPVLTSCYSDGDAYLWLLKPTGLNRGRGI